VEVLTSALLPLYFSHSRYHSFTRQLNMYGFTCVFSGGAAEDEQHTARTSLPRARPRRYSHPHFTRDRPDDVRVRFDCCCVAKRHQPSRCFVG
jgi:hypothetical protein